jgi:uncharacterized RDD family membrane protein YckC
MAAPVPPQYSADGRWFWTGTAWFPTGYGAPSWKGARYGRPSSGPGSLAEPARRLAARLLDGLVASPAFLALAAVALALVAPHAGRIFPRQNPDPNATQPTPGFIWLYMAVLGAGLVNAVLYVAYETIATVRYGRTLGKAWMRIRPIRTDGRPLGWGPAFGRLAVYWASGLLSWVGMLDPLWCLWDDNSQCLHDKAVGTLVIND